MQAQGVSFQRWQLPDLEKNCARRDDWVFLHA